MHIQRRNPQRRNPASRSDTSRINPTEREETRARDEAPVPDETQAQNDMGGNDMGGARGDKEPEVGLESDPIVGELRKLYDRVAEEPLPDELLELLRKLDDAERNR